MNALDALILGVVEGLTEFLPISSTGHLILTSSLLGLSGDFVKSFEIAIQLGAILAVLIFFGFRRFLSKALLVRIALAFIPTGAIGFLMYPVLKSYLLESNTVVLSSLFLGGIALIFFEWWHREKEGDAISVEQISYWQAFAVGCCQSIALIPGVSRAAATIVGGLALGVPRVTIVEFSFLLAVPTMLVATGYDLLQSGSSFSPDEYGLLALGFSAAFLTALFSIRWLLSFITTHTFTPFGYYRILLALLFWFVIV